MRKKLYLKKWKFFRKEVKYLSHITSERGITTDPGKRHMLWQTGLAINKHEVRVFLRLCTHYRKFVENFTDIARPLHPLTGYTAVRVEW